MNAPMELPHGIRVGLTPSLRQCPGLVDLVDIFDPAAQLAVHPRDPDPAIETWLQAATESGVLGSGFRTRLSNAEFVVDSQFADLSGRKQLVADINALVDVYRDLLGCPHVGVRLEVIAQAMCPRFHVDRVGIRLLCTYRGPGTEWLDDSHADRSRLAGRVNRGTDEESGLILHASAVQRVAPFAVVLLKGSLWQGNGKRGVIHRSPIVPASSAPRVLLALDALWE
jgi:hypothetical protein